MRESLASFYEQIANMLPRNRSVIYPVGGEGGSWSNAYVHLIQNFASSVMPFSMQVTLLNQRHPAFVFGTRRKSVTPREKYEEATGNIIKKQN